AAAAGASLLVLALLLILAAWIAAHRYDQWRKANFVFTAVSRIMIPGGPEELEKAATAAHQVEIDPKLCALTTSATMDGVLEIQAVSKDEHAAIGVAKSAELLASLQVRDDLPDR